MRHYTHLSMTSQFSTYIPTHRRLCPGHSFDHWTAELPASGPQGQSENVPIAITCNFEQVSDLRFDTFGFRPHRTLAVDSAFGINYTYLSLYQCEPPHPPIKYLKIIGRGVYSLRFPLSLSRPQVMIAAAVQSPSVYVSITFRNLSFVILYPRLAEHKLSPKC